MISVVIPTCNSAAALASTLAALVPAAIHSLVREVVVADAGSTDETLEIAEDGGARVLSVAPGLGRQLAAGCDAAKGPWLLILAPDARLAPEWEAAARAHMDHHAERAGYFRLALDDHRMSARLAEIGLSLRSAFAPPGAAHGLLVSKRLYEAAGGCAPDAPDPVRTLARRIGGGRLRPLPARVFVGRPYGSSSS